MNVFEEQGIQFKVISPDMYEDVMDFLWTHFFPVAPVFRSMGVTRHWIFDSLIYPAAFKHSCSIAALDQSGNILAVRVGSIKERTHWASWLVDKMIKFFPYRLFSPFLSPFFQKVPVVWTLMGLLDWDVWTKFEAWSCESIYEGVTVCSARTHGVRGLGSEVVRRCEVLARERGCSHTFLCATGNYSKKLFVGLGYTQLKAVNYDEFRDEQGQLYLQDTREHIAATTFCKQL